MVNVLNKTLCSSCFEPIGSEPCPHCGFSEGSFENDMGTLPSGTVLQERYRLGRVMGKGGFGVTYLAYDMKMDRKIAIKEYYPYGFALRGAGTTIVSVTGSGDAAETFRKGAEKFYNEARMVAKYNDNPGIVNVYDFFYENATVYYTMEYLKGKSLKDRIAQKGVLSKEQAEAIAKCIASALASPHAENVLHRDISPDNIIICDDGKIKLIDFGAARQVLESGRQALSVILKPGFAPLEQYQKNGRQGPWTDIYSLGATLFYGLTGKMPEDPMARLEDDSEFSSDVEKLPRGLREIIRKMLMMRIEDRYQNVYDLKNDLDNIDRIAAEFEEAAAAKMEVDKALFNGGSGYSVSGYSGSVSSVSVNSSAVNSVSAGGSGNSGSGNYSPQMAPTVALQKKGMGTESPAFSQSGSVNSVSDYSSPVSGGSGNSGTGSYSPQMAPTVALQRRGAAESPVYNSFADASEQTSGAVQNPVSYANTGFQNGTAPYDNPYAASSELTTERAEGLSARKRVLRIIIIAAVVLAVVFIVLKIVFSISANPKEVTIGGVSYRTDMTGTLDLTGKALTDDDIRDLKYMKNLTGLNLTFNTITDLSAISGLTQLETLNLDVNPVSDLSFCRDLVNLKTLTVSNTLIATNGIEDISPLAGLTELSYIDLSGNNISDLSPLSNWTNHISYGGFNDNSISDFTPLANCTFDELHVENNALDGNLSGLKGLIVTGNIYAEGNNLGKLGEQFVQLFIDHYMYSDEDGFTLYW